MYLKLAHRLSVNLNHLSARRESLEEMERVARLPSLLFFPTPPTELDIEGEEEEEEESDYKQREAVIGLSNRLGGPGALVLLQLHSLSKPPLRWIVLPGCAKGGLKPIVLAPERTVRLSRPPPDANKRVEHAALEFLLRERASLSRASSSSSPLPQGMHSENGLMLTLFALFFIEFESLPIVRQRRPPGNDWPGVLFLEGEEGEDLAQRILRRLREGEAPAMVEYAWEKHFEGRTRVRGLNWERNTKAELREIARCVPGAVLAGISRLFLEAYDAWNGGLPDLFLWDAAHSWSAFVEVKGPGDSLSERQRAWNEKLVEFGAEVSTVYVEWEGMGFVVPPPPARSSSSSSSSTSLSPRDVVQVVDLCDD